ncbi:MAG: T9SS type A sorting domain-containing protein [Bacteroidetes bacterium]|nr:T9SS type A sorting domain-containing protein [Bacteroidota bacterium]
MCIDKVFSVVNEKYERVTSLKGECKVISGIQYQNNPYGAKLFPNPFNQNATLSFTNIKNEKLKLDIIDIQGKIVKDLGFINGNNYYFENLNLPNGLYFYRLTGLKTQVGKLLIE